MQPDGQAPHILVISDSEDILDLLQELLEEEGYRVTTTTATLPTPEAVVALRPDLVILDYIWGSDDSGWSLLQQLRNDSRTRALPIILCTGALHQLELVQDQLPVMHVTLLRKPFDIDDMVGTVSQLLGQDISNVPGPQPGE